MKPYHWLFERTHGQWTLSFGSYDRADVVAERLDRRDHDVRASDLKIVRAPDDRQNTADQILRDLRNSIG